MPLKKTKQTDSTDTFEEIYAKQIQDFANLNTKESNQKENIFESIKVLDEKYEYIMKAGKERNDIRLNVVQKRNQELHDSLVNDRMQLIEEEMINIENEIKKSVETQTQINDKIMIELQKSYQESKDKILKKVLKMLEFEFI